MAYIPDSEAYNDYYGRHPERKSRDDTVRQMTRLLRPGSRYYDDKISTQARYYFQIIPEIQVPAKVVSKWTEQLKSAPDKSLLIKQAVKSLGAVDVFIFELPK